MIHCFRSKYKCKYFKGVMNTDKYRKAFNELSKRSVLVGFLKEMVFRFAKIDIENHGKGHIVRSV